MWQFCISRSLIQKWLVSLAYWNCQINISIKKLQCLMPDCYSVTSMPLFLLPIWPGVKITSIGGCYIVIIMFPRICVNGCSKKWLVEVEVYQLSCPIIIFKFYNLLSRLLCFFACVTNFCAEWPMFLWKFHRISVPNDFSSFFLKLWLLEP